MHPLLRIALLTCPGEFRRHCADELSADLARTRAVPLPLWATCVNVAWTGVRLHAENIWRDVSYAARVLGKAPVFVVVATLTIALAIGANLVAFSVVKGMLLDPLPYPHGDRLAFVEGVKQRQAQTSIDYPDARDYAQRSRTFAAISVETSASGALTGVGPPVELRGWYVGGDYFSVLGVQPELGRLLSRSDLGKRRIVISDELWRSKFGANVAVLGRPVAIDDRKYTVVGVAPPHFYNPGPGFMERVDYFVPINPRSANERGYYAFWAIGRLREGVTWAQAQADLSRISAQLAREYPAYNRNRGVSVRSLYDALTGPMRLLILMLYGACVLVLLIAAGNIANLLLVRAASRRYELAVRSALGAAKRRIATQLAVETGLVGVAGLAVASVLAWLCLQSMRATLTGLTQAYGMSMILPNWNHVALSIPVLLYGAALTLLFTVGTTLLPLYTDGFASSLNAAGRGAGVVRHARLRAALAASEVVLAFAVLCIAGLFVQSLAKLERTPVGFREANVYSVQIDLPASPRYAGARAEQFYLRAAQSFRTLPGVADAAEAMVAGMGSFSSTNYSTRATADRAGLDDVEFNSVSPAFFETLGIPLLQGRIFEQSDTATSQPVAIVSKAFALRNFGSVAGALEGHVSVGESSGGGFPLRRIVGVVADVRHALSAPPSPEVYVPFSQVHFPGTIVVRTKRYDPRLASDIDAALSRLDPRLPPPQVLAFGRLRLFNDFPNRVATIVLLVLAGVALVLALAGIYGVVAYGVARRTHEFGIRMSLGAQKRKIAVEVVREAVLLAAVGIAIGLVLDAFAAGAIAQFLYQTSPQDPFTFASAAAFLMAAVILAASVPAARAMRVQPATALRCE